jgi:hypothetical protein
MRLLFIGALAPAAIFAATPAVARPTRVDVPVQIDPNSSIYILWVTVKADGDRTLVRGYVRHRQWFARKRGDLHIEFLRHGQRVACQETDWKKYRHHTRGQWRFETSVEVPAAILDTIRVSHVIHDQNAERAPDRANACSAVAAPTNPNSGGA